MNRLWRAPQGSLDRLRCRRGKRQEIIALTGQSDVPVLVLDDGAFVAGSAAIVAWAADRSR